MNCPNCGAPIAGGICEYCGSRVKNDNDIFIEIKIDEKKLRAELLESQLRFARATGYPYVRGLL